MLLTLFGFLIIIVLFSLYHASERFASVPVGSSSGIPRAGVTRGELLAPSTPGRLGYLAADGLMG
jgi:hypothetical protein